MPGKRFCKYQSKAEYFEDAKYNTFWLILDDFIHILLIYTVFFSSLHMCFCPNEHVCLENYKGMNRIFWRTLLKKEFL